MEKILLSIISSLVTLVLTGCFQNETTIHLNKDGSGTLIEENRIGANILAQAEKSAPPGEAKKARDAQLAHYFSTAKFKAHAAELGKGVTFEKSEPIKDNGSEGFRVTYRFKDINQLKVTFGDSVNEGAMKSMSEAKAATVRTQSSIAFAYAGGKLTIKMPESPKTESPEVGKTTGGGEMDNPEAQAQIQGMLSDMKMSLKVIVEPGITETNATYMTDKTITLVSMDMGKLLKQDKDGTMKKISKVGKNSPTASMELMQSLKGTDGVQFENKKQVTVTVK